jgi:hypothetical protein
MATVPATNQQVQTFVDQNVRPRSESIRALYLQCKNDAATISDIYAALTEPSPTWSDSRTDGPPHLAQPSDVLAWNTFVVGFIAFVEGTQTAQNMNSAAPQYAIVQDLCVRPVQG